MNTTKATLRITWIDNDGNAACIGLDESLEVDMPLDAADAEIALAQAKDDAIYNAECRKIDTERYQPVVEFDS